MTTSRQIIERAYRKLRVVAIDEPMTADQAQTGLVALNSMMHGWELQGVSIGHSDLALITEFNMAERFHEAVVYCLAAKMAPDLSAQPPDADPHFRTIQAHYIDVPVSKIGLSLRYPPSRGRWGGL